MTPRLFRRLAFWCLLVFGGVVGRAAELPPAGDANRLTYLDGNDPFDVGADFPKLTTPQWIGEPDVEAAIILAIDDLREPQKYEAFLRPILDRLKRIDGTAPLSIFCNRLAPQDPQFQTWLKEGLSLEVHTLTHPCPLLAGSNFNAAAEIYQGCVDLLHQIPGNQPVAFRMPCCDSMDSPSPRFYAELFNQVTPGGHFLTIDSSVMNITTAADPQLPRELTTEPGGRGRFQKFFVTQTNAQSKVSMASFVTTIENYPYPYVIGRLCWEFPAALPSDWEAQNLQNTNNPATVADWEAGVDAAVLKQGTFTMIFHPHGWIRNTQLVELIDYAVGKYGKKVKFLTFREAQERLNRNLLAGHPLRAANGADNGVRLLDLNHDGYLDVVIGDGQTRLSRVWRPAERKWQDSDFPTALVVPNSTGGTMDAGVKFGVVRPDQSVSAFVQTEDARAAWHFDGARWVEDRGFFRGLEVDGQPTPTRRGGVDRGVRLRDVNRDGRCELIVSNPEQNAIFSWDETADLWKRLPYALPPGASIVNEAGVDNGLRFVDLNHDGYDDVVFSNERAYSAHVFVPVARPNVDWKQGWSLEVKAGPRSDPGAIPMIARGGSRPNNGAWFHGDSMWVQNEETSQLPDKVDRRSFDQLLTENGPPPKSPEESLAAIHVRPGFKVELVVHEPLVLDPIAFEWGADGKLWVVEMGDYPLGVDGNGKFGGVIRYLEDTKGDGHYDKSTVFLEGVGFPTGVMPWGKGVLVSAAPEIFYAEDTDGDGKADVRKTLFKGFREGNQQHRVNGFEYGLDNWLYGANGNSGGLVRSLLTGKEVNISGRDFRFNPVTGEFQTQAGQTQYGRHRDDWGNWFGNENPTWLWHYVLQEQYLARNPYLAVKSTRRVLSNYPDPNRIYTISPTMRRFNWPDAINVVTSANSATPYRDELFGPDFESSVFASEPVNNVVHREVLSPDGATFTGRRAPDEQNSEFLASTDNWFRPTMMKTGPDGALYIADMYRLVIEHPEWIPAEQIKHLDLRAGSDKGRIYRVYPTSATPRKVPRLDRLDAAGLVAALDSPNGWQRDTVQRLIVQSGDRSVAPALAALARHSARPKTRLQALWTLQGLKVLTVDDLEVALQDQHPAVREQAVQLTEMIPNSLGAERRDEEAVFDRLLARLVDDANPRVRYQLAFTLGEWRNPRAGTALGQLALRDFGDPLMQTAIMSSAVPHLGGMLDVVLRDATVEPNATLVEQLTALAVDLKDQDAELKALTEAGKPSGGAIPSWRMAALAGFLDALDRHSASLPRFVADAPPSLKEAAHRLEPLFTEAQSVCAKDAAGRQPEGRTLLAIRLLGRGLAAQSADAERLSQLLGPQFPSSIQRAALAALGRFSEPRVAEWLLSQWNALSPELRSAALSVLFSRSEWVDQLVTAVETKRVLVSQLGAPARQRLLTYGNADVRARAEKLLTAANSDRRGVLKDFASVADLIGKPANGAALFRQNCMTCHRLKGEGAEIGPDLAGLADKPLEVLMVAILDPNQAVEARYLSYTAVTKSGRDLTGIIASETSASLVLRGPGGFEETILRSDLKELTASGLSLMPEGFEKILKPQDLADLIAYIKSK